MSLYKPSNIKKVLMAKENPAAIMTQSRKLKERKKVKAKIQILE